jgi:hypothetical protein
MSSHMPSNNSTSMVILKVDNCSSFQDVLFLLKPKLLLPYSQYPVFVPFTKTFYIHFQVNHVFLLPAIHSITYAFHPRRANPRYQATFFTDFTSVPYVLPVTPNSVSFQPNDVQWRQKKLQLHKSPVHSSVSPYCVNFLNNTSFPENVCRCNYFTLTLVVACPSGLQYYVCDWVLNTYVLLSRLWLRTTNHIIVCCW